MERISEAIGTLNEGELHAGIKHWYADASDLVEHPVDGYVVDLVRGDLLIEVQTGGFSPLREKLPALLQRHPVRLVVPVARTRHIVRLNDDGEILSRRRAPKRGRYEDIFEKLVSIPQLIKHRSFELELLLTEEDEFRVHRPGQAWRRKGWVVQGRALVEILETRRISNQSDLATFLPADLPEPFTTADLATVGKIPRKIAQQMAYCLLRAGVLEGAGKLRNAHLYLVRDDLE